MEIVDNILFLDISGPFNEYDIIAITEEVRLGIEQFHQKSFFLLIDIHHTEGGTPEGFEESRKFNLWLDEQNLIAKAIICSSAAFIEINESRVRDTKKQRIQYFCNKETAMNWFHTFLS